MKIHRFLYTLAAILMLSSCSITDSADFATDEVEFLDIEFRATVENSKLIEFRNQNAWEAFWNEHIDLHNPAISEFFPEVDFQRNWVAGVFWGQSSGCTSQANHGITGVGLMNAKAFINTTGMPYTGACRMIVHPRAFLVFPKTVKSAEVRWGED